jgi:DNA primase
LANSGELELAVMPLPPCQDPDALLRQDGAEAFRQRLAGAVHWLHWELEQLLAPALAAPEDLAVLQRCDRKASQLLALLPAGGLRQRAEQRLRNALGAVPQGAVGQVRAREEPSGDVVPTARWRAERRALRLYLCNPGTRDLLGQLQLSDPLHREALSCLRQLQQRIPVAPHGHGADASGLDPLAAVALSLCRRLDPPLAGLLQELVQCGPEVCRLLQADPVPELQVVLELIEPVG